MTSLRTDSWKRMLIVKNETVCLKFDDSDYCFCSPFQKVISISVVCKVFGDFGGGFPIPE